MYKYSNAEHTAVTNTQTDATNITPNNWMWEEYQKWVDAGGVTEPYKSSDELFAGAQSAKYAEIEAAFAAAEATPVSVNGWLFKGGFTSALAIDAMRRFVQENAADMPELGITTVDFFDVYGQTITVPIESDTEIDSKEVALSVGIMTKTNTFKYAQLMAAIGSATTVEELQAISW